MRVIVADDDFTSRNILSAVLTKCGHEVIEAVNGEEAVRALSALASPLVCILDWLMPVMDGLEAIRKIRALDLAHPPYVIMLTSKNAKADIIQGLDAGANDYLSKPFDPGELRARVEVGCRFVEMQERLAAQIRELRLASDHIKTLQGILPMCGFCRKIRNDRGYWDQVEVYISEHTEVQFSHGVCPECAVKYYPGFIEKDSEQA